METTTETKKRTITMTGRRPVTIREDEWPVIARGSESWHDGQVECQANETIAVAIRVRRHADGRAIVYGSYIYDTAFQGRRGSTARAGHMVKSGGDIATAIRFVADDLRRDGHDDRMINDTRDECISHLPAEEL
jgi:hypothetical protein